MINATKDKGLPLEKKEARFSRQLQEIMCSSCSIPGNCNGCSFYGEENEFFEPSK